MISVTYSAGSYGRQAKKIVNKGTEEAMNRGYIKDIHLKHTDLDYIKEPIDIYHCHSSYSLKGIIKAKSLGAKVILQRDSSHCTPFVDNLEKEESKWRNTEYKFLCDNNARNRTDFDSQIAEYDNADYILLASKLERNSFLKMGYPKEKLKVIPFTADCEIFYPMNKKHDFSVVLGGNQHLRKGYPYAKEACKQAGIPLNVIDGITFEQVPNELNQHTVILAPSADDGYPHQVLAGMACGLIPIVSTLNGVKDIIINKKNGFIVNLNDNDVIKQIADVLRYLKENPKKAKQISLKARKTIEKRTWEDYSNDVANFYEEIIGELK